MRHNDVDGGAVELESHGGGGGTAVAPYASFGRTTIPRRAAAAARRQNTHDDVDVDDAMTTGTTNASKDGGTMPTANHGGKWLRVVDVAIDKGSDDGDGDGNGDGNGNGNGDGYDGRHLPVVPPWWWWRGSME
jgi:hypothetical protein